MKKLFAGIAVVGFAFIASAQTITFNNTTLDYGTIKQGSDGNREFVIKNTGDKPLIISNVAPSCGCTTADYTKTPIKPGKKGFVEASYNAASPGAFVKTVNVTTSDSKTPKTLSFKGVVTAS